MDEPGEVAASRAMLEVELDLADVEPRPERVDRHPRLDPEAGGDREHRGSSCGRERPLPGERLLDDAASPALDQGTPNALGEPEPPAGAPFESGDGKVGVGLHEWPQLADEVGIAEEK